MLSRLRRAPSLAWLELAQDIKDTSGTDIISNEGLKMGGASDLHHTIAHVGIERVVGTEGDDSIALSC